MTRLEQVGDRVASHLESILKLFVPGAKIMVLVRIPGKDTADFTMGDLSLEEAAELIQRRMADPEAIEVGPDAKGGAP